MTVGEMLDDAHRGWRDAMQREEESRALARQAIDRLAAAERVVDAARAVVASPKDEPWKERDALDDALRDYDARVP